jgi:DNA polymerase III delta prime subunit
MLTHHAYVIYSGGINTGLSEEFVANFGFDDVSTVEVNSFGIDDSRQLIKDSYTQPSDLNLKKIIIVKAETINIEAQQALLKILEEPPKSTVFLFILPNESSIISTLKSRFLEYRSSVNIQTEYCISESFRDFCKLNYKDRLSLIVKRLEKEDIQWVKDIKYSLASMLNDSVHTIDANKLKVLSMVVTTLNTRGASNKLLLEELALTLPYTAEK